MKAFALVCLLLLIAPAGHSITLAEIAGSLEKAKPSILKTTIVPRGEAKQLNQWQNAFHDWDAIQNRYQACLADAKNCSSDLWHWRHMVLSIKDKPLDQKLAATQTFFNKWAYKPDEKEYWNNPTKTFKDRAGDCEDLALIKYFTLSLIGVAEKDMKVVAARDKVTGKMHALLVVGNTLLDNSGAPMNYTTRYQPRYSFNRFEKWLHI